MRPLDLTDVAAVAAEAARRVERRRAGLPLHDAEELAATTREDRASCHRAPVSGAGEYLAPTTGGRSRKNDSGGSGPSGVVPAGWMEKAEARVVWRILLALGWRAYWLSQARRTGQTRGLGDIYALHEGRGLALWCEMKRPLDPAVVTSDQRTFAEANVRCGVHAIIGTADDVAAWLRAQGFDPPPVVRTR